MAGASYDTQPQTCNLHSWCSEEAVFYKMTSVQAIVTLRLGSGT